MAKYLFLCSFLILNCFKSNSQNESTPSNSRTFFNEQIELRHDNDFLIFTDRYYTTGSYIEYRFLNNDESSPNKKDQVLIGLEHLYFTPSNIISSNTKDFDRPYAGYLGIRAGNSIARTSHIFNFALGIGVTGRISQAEAFQKMFHSTTESSKIPPWVAQIKNDFHINFYSGFVKEWQLLPKPFAVYASINPKIAVGTYNVYLDQGFKFFFGKRNSLLETMAYNHLGEAKNEFFFSVNFAYRYVMHNALIEGYPFGKPSEFTLEANKELYLYGINGYFRTRRHDFILGYQYVSKETLKADWHTYFTISIARRF